MTAPVFVLDGPDAPPLAAPGDIWLTGPEGRHAVSVRRMRTGEEVVLTDGAGTGAYGSVTAVEGKDRLRVAVTGVRTEPEPQPRITVVQALPKGDRGELAVETMTETGVDVIVPWKASRCITQWRAERGAKSLAKWRATAREAGKQSRRLRFVPLATAPLPERGDIVLVVGPEGGVSPDELAAFAEAGAAPHRLGNTVLRTSTAGTAAAALLLARTGRWS
jgi:16S rRNA (uracil1498-N3)-methyltransferase